MAKAKDNQQHTLKFNFWKSNQIRLTTFEALEILSGCPDG